MWFSVVLGVVLAVGLFFILPLLVIRFFDPFITSSFLSNLLEGVIRIIFFLIYLYLSLLGVLIHSHFFLPI